MTLACIYLARAAEGLEPARQFLSSYRRHGAGAEHALIVIYKGWDPAGLEAARAVFAAEPHRALLMDDEGYDIGSYLRATRLVADEFEYLCFLNTFSQIQADGWLGRLLAAGRAPGVGAAAATGSFESHADTARFLESLRFAYRYGTMPAGAPGELGVAALHAIFIRKQPPRGLKKWIGVPAKAALRRAAYRAGLVREEVRLAAAFRSGRSQAWTRTYDPFPNVHLRTNALLIRTTLLNSFGFAMPRSKFDAYAFESGPNGLSARVGAAGLGLRLVGADGIAYAPSDWPKAGTFRSLDQYNLLVSDNQTRAYEQMSPHARLAYQFLTWGSAMMAPLPPSFPRFALAFDAAPAARAA